MGINRHPVEKRDPGRFGKLFWIPDFTKMTEKTVCKTKNVSRHDAREVRHKIPR